MTSDKMGVRARRSFPLQKLNGDETATMLRAQLFCCLKVSPNVAFSYHWMIAGDQTSLSLTKTKTDTGQLICSQALGPYHSPESNHTWSLFHMRANAFGQCLLASSLYAPWGLTCPVCLFMACTVKDSFSSSMTDSVSLALKSRGHVL